MSDRFLAWPATGAPLCRRERGLLWASGALVLLAMVLPSAWGEGWHSHHFADARSWWGIPCTLDVLSNLPFALAGLWGLWQLGAARISDDGVAWRRCAGLFFFGLLCTAVGSSAYHWQPDDVGLLWDRAAMSVAFAGMLGLATVECVSPRAGQVMAVFSLIAGGLALMVWTATANAMPWAVMQFGGLILLLGLALLPAVPGPARLSLVAVIAIYGAAKGLEVADAWIWQWSDGWVAGHAQKHLVAALAAWPVLRAWRRRNEAWSGATLRHNARQETSRPVRL